MAEIHIRAEVAAAYRRGLDDGIRIAVKAMPIWMFIFLGCGAVLGWIARSVLWPDLLGIAP